MCSFLYYLMSTKKIIYYILRNKSIRINLYKLHFYPPTFFLNQTKELFIPPTFPPLQPNTHNEKLNFSIIPLFHLFTNFLSAHFSILQPNRPKVKYEKLETCWNHHYSRPTICQFNKIKPSNRENKINHASTEQKNQMKTQKLYEKP